MEEKTKEKEQEKCFIIMPISDQGDYPEGHFTKVYEQIIKPAVIDAGYIPYRVDENKICDAIINKIFDAIQECPMAICDLSNKNPNVLYELGLRQAYDKPVVLIQDEKTNKIFDVSGISTVFYKSTRLYEDVIEARENIKSAILSTKEGKVNSLVKIMKANIADFSEVEVSQDDRLKVILDGIYEELRKINNINNDDNISNNHLVKTYYLKKEDIYQIDICDLERMFAMLRRDDVKDREKYISLIRRVENLEAKVKFDKEVLGSMRFRILDKIDNLKSDINTTLYNLQEA